MHRARSWTELIEQLSAFESLNAFDSLSSDAFVAFIEPPSLDDRILNQFALFSIVSNPAVGLDGWLAEHDDLVRRVASRQS